MVPDPAACKMSDNVLRYVLSKNGWKCTFSAPYACRFCHQRPVRGKKKPSATTLASGLGMTFFLFSTSMRDENVLTFKTLGPDILSAASRAIGWIMARSRPEAIRVSGAFRSAAYNLCSLSGSCLLGKAVAAILGFRSSSSSL